MNRYFAKEDIQIVHNYMIDIQHHYPEEFNYKGIL